MLANLAITPIVKFIRKVTAQTSEGPKTVPKGTLAMVHANDQHRAEVLVEGGDGQSFICAVGEGDVEPV